MTEQIYTAEELKTWEVAGPVRYDDGYDGAASQHFEAVNNPRLTYVWSRENYNDEGRTHYEVDGIKVADLEEAAKLLSLPPDPNSPREISRKREERYDESPKLGGCYIALNIAEMNARKWPMAPISAWSERVSHAWHVGINKYAESLRLNKSEEPWPHWLYDIKTISYELSRLQLLWARDRKQDTDLKCALGVRCRDCKILQTIEASMNEQRKQPFYSKITDGDIDAVKTFTCAGHVMFNANRAYGLMSDDGLISTADDRKSVDRDPACYEMKQGDE